jgi:para-aminobenzoate synthetase component I
MSLFDQDYFLFVPSDTKGKGKLYSLTPSDSETEHCLIVVTYAHPAKQAPLPNYYTILSETETELPQAGTQEKTDIVLMASQTKEEYLQKVQQLKTHIQRGDIYEINYCLQFEAKDVSIDPIAVYKRLHELGKAPYSMFLKLKEEYVLCESPELFLKKTGIRIESKPIKGTAKRGATKEEDETLKHDLQHSLKERTENVMAVDVARNDLSILAARDTVRVNKLYNIETFETVHQMVSTVSCELKRDFSMQEILTATFPMASMTGAPKRRAMDFINEYESFERGLYSGAIGICKNGDFELAVVIRSIFYTAASKQVRIAVGGAITYLSDAEKEYEECLLKAKSMLRALGARIG